MDEVTREYLDSLAKVAENTIPKDTQLPDEYVWLEITKCLFNNNSVTSTRTNNEILSASDWVLVEFKRRFRD